MCRGRSTGSHGLARERPEPGSLYTRPMTGFEGFEDANAKFFKSLAKNNTRPWFLAHKAEFEAEWNAPMKLLLADVRDAIDGAYPHCDLAEPKVFRIFRDVRFSKDKSPYKTHLGGFIAIEQKERESRICRWRSISMSARRKRWARPDTT